MCFCWLWYIGCRLTDRKEAAEPVEPKKRGRPEAGASSPASGGASASPEAKTKARESKI